MTSLIRRILALYDLIPYSLVALLARVVVGLVFHNSWLTKVDLETWTIKSSTYFLFANEYKVPLLPSDLAAVLATLAEGLLPVLLWLGLGTRLAATGLLAMVLVIQTFVYPHAFMDHGLWAIGLLVLMRFGPGKLSLDHLIANRPVAS